MATFNQQLELLNMSSSNKEEKTGLLFVDSLNDNNISIPYHERIELEQAQLFQATAIYFRYFSDGRPPIPQVYIYDNTSSFFNEQRIVELNKNIWNTGKVRLVYFFFKDELKVYNTAQPVTIDKEGNLTKKPYDCLTIEDTIDLGVKLKKQLEKYSAHRLDNGFFWEDHSLSKDFDLKHTIYVRLITELKEARGSFISKTNLAPKVANKLLVLCILVKYLEERGVFDVNQNFWNKYQTGGFIETINANKLLELFQELSEHFNGKIFKLENDEIEAIRTLNLGILANFLSGDVETKTKQKVLWPLYDFEYIPVELISNIYEEFLKDSKEAVYTPSFLVRFLVDEAMPLDEPKTKFKVLDPSCGSGIFLVVAYKRLVEWWRINEHQKSGKWVDITAKHIQILQQLLLDNIYGVDIKEEAANLTRFSLTLALCNLLSPKAIWNDLKFNDLGENNIKYQDFFEYLNPKKENPIFDLIIGNPPFTQLKKDSYKKIINSSDFELTTNKIPYNQSALLFLDQSMHLLKKGGLNCMILPSGPLLYNEQSVDFRQSFFSKYNVALIVDFSCLSEKLFSKANIATASIFVQKKEAQKIPTQHIVVRNLITHQSQLMIELDYYDHYNVTYHDSLNTPFAWKANLIGGGKRLLNLIRYLSELDALKDFIVNQKNWVYNVGFMIGNQSKPAAYITEIPLLPVKAFTNKGINISEISPCEYTMFERIRSKELFTPPLLLIKQTISSQDGIPMFFWTTGSITYQRGILGIHAPASDKQKLKKLHQKLIKNNLLNTFYIMCTSGRVGVNKATSILKRDIDKIPYPKDEKDLELSYTEEIIKDDTLNYMFEFLKKGTNATILKQAATKKDISNFGKAFCYVLNKVYTKDNDIFYQGDSTFTDNYIITTFHYGKEQSTPSKFIEDNSFDENLKGLLHQKYGNHLSINKVMKVYGENVTYLIKPKSLRYWLQSIALRDADEVFEDLIKAGY